MTRFTEGLQIKEVDGNIYVCICKYMYIMYSGRIYHVSLTQDGRVKQATFEPRKAKTAHVTDGKFTSAIVCG